MKTQTVPPQFIFFKSFILPFLELIPPKNLRTVGLEHSLVPINGNLTREHEAPHFSASSFISEGGKLKSKDQKWEKSTSGIMIIEVS